MNKKAKFLFFCMIFVVAFTFGQGKAPFSFSKIAHKPFNYKQIETKRATTLLTGTPILNFNSVAYSLISPSYYTNNFGFFCKKELAIEKLAKLPIKIRLGSVQQCDWMEGKPNAVRAF